jgi:hypothetical protein
MVEDNAEVQSKSSWMADMQSLAHFVVVLTKDSWKNTGGKNSDSWVPLEEEQELRN